MLAMWISRLDMLFLNYAICCTCHVHTCQHCVVRVLTDFSFFSQVFILDTLQTNFLHTILEKPDTMHTAREIHYQKRLFCY